MQLFLQANGHYPRTSISQNGQKRLASTYTPQEQKEVVLANSVNRTIQRAKDLDDPIIRELLRLRNYYHP